MKVLRKVCSYCGYVALFSVEVLCRPDTAMEIGPRCPECGTARNIVATITELDMEEIGPDPDIAAIEETIAKFTDNLAPRTP